MILPLNGFGSTNLIPFYGWFLLFANGASAGIVASVCVIYMGIEKNSMDGPACCYAVVAFF